MLGMMMGLGKRIISDRGKELKMRDHNLHENNCVPYMHICRNDDGSWKKKEKSIASKSTHICQLKHS